MVLASALSSIIFYRPFLELYAIGANFTSKKEDKNFRDTELVLASWLTCYNSPKVKNLVGVVQP